MPKEVRQTIKARKMRFIHVSPSNKLGPKGRSNKYMGFAKESYWRVFLNTGIIGTAMTSIPSSLKDSASSRVVCPRMLRSGDSL